MLKKMTLKIFWILLILVQTMFSQEVKNEAQKPYSIGVPSKVEHVPSIASRKKQSSKAGFKFQSGDVRWKVF